MRKFVIERTKGDEENIIKCFDNRDEAMAFGTEYAAGLTRRDGVVTLEEREVNEAGQLETMWNAFTIFGVERSGHAQGYL